MRMRFCLGFYFWEHIFENTLQQQSKAWSYGQVTLEDLSLRLLSSVPEPSDFTYYVLDEICKDVYT